MYRSTMHLAAFLAVGFLLAPAVLAQSGLRATDAPASRPDVSTAAPYQAPTGGRGGLTFYTTRAAFDAANPGLPVEDFEDLNAPSGSFCVSSSPADASTSNDCVSPGDILPGLAVAAVGLNSGGPDALVAIGAGGLGTNYGSVVFGANYFADDTDLRFSPGVDAVGTDVYAFFGGGTTTVEVYDTSSNLLGTTTIPATTTVQFVGVRSDGADIGRVFLVLPNDDPFADNVAFGNAGSACSLSLNNPDISPNSVAPGGTVTFSGSVVQSGPGSKSISLRANYDGPGSLAGSLNLGSASGVPPGTYPFSRPVRVPGNAPSGQYVVTLQVINSSTGEVCDEYTETITVTAPRLGEGTGTVPFEVVAPDAPLFEASATTTSSAVSPNPFARRTQIAYTVAATANVRLSVYDVLGREVAVLVDGTVEAGQHAATFDARGLSSGTYVYRLVVGSDVQTGRMTLAH